MRLILNQIGRRLTESLDTDRRRQKLLLMLDEFAALGRLDFFESQLTFMAGYGIRSFLITQSLNQLERAYGPNHAILDNCHIRIAFSTNDERTAKRVSDALGTATEMRESVGVSTAPDPVFDAIEGHRRAFEELGHLLAEQDAAERELRRAPGGGRPELEAKLTGLCGAEGALGRAEIKASRRLATTVPGSLKGAAAALQYVRACYEVGQYPLYEEDGYRLLLLSTERAICAAAGLAFPRFGRRDSPAATD